jgi:hypothetical protein
MFHKIGISAENTFVLRFTNMSTSIWYGEKEVNYTSKKIV